MDATRRNSRLDADLERLADTPDSGWLLLTILSLNGWSVTVEPGFAGKPMVVATHPSLAFPVQRLGFVADVALEVFKEAASYAPLIDPGDTQLRLLH
jgi:hypothetical protein